MRNLARLLALAPLAASALALLAGCPDGKVPPGAGGCEDKRKLLDCESEIRYQGVKTEGGVHVLNIGGANAAIADTALHQVNEKVEQYVATQTRLCREYNSCIVDGDKYHAEARELRERLQGVAPLVAKVNGTDARGRAEAADQILATVGGAKTTTPLSISVALEAELPPSAGGKTLVLPPNYPLPTNARVAFKFSVTQSAHVYLFQVDAQNKVSVLFPDERIATKNPLPSGGAVRIPENGQRFRVDENGLGTEHVYIVVSSRPLTSLDKTLKRYASGQADELKQDSGLSEFANLQQGRALSDCGTRTRDLKLVDDAPAPGGGASDGCAKTRGLVLDEAPQPNQPVTHSMQARAAAGDDVIVKFFPFQHVTEAAFRQKLDEYNAPGVQGERTRGISIEN